jgi:hypothetical protein
MVKVLIFLLIFLSSCAVKEKKCQIIYNKTLESQKQLPDKYEANGFIYIKSLPAIFKAYFSEEEKINFYTVFGTKLGQIKKEKNIICINLPQISQCGDENFYSRFLGIDIPQKLKNLLIGKIKFSKNSRYYCTDKGLVIEDDGVKYIFKNERLDTILYDSYKIEYEYYTDKTIITIFSGDIKLTIIEIKNIKAL